MWRTILPPSGLANSLIPNCRRGHFDNVDVHPPLKTAPKHTEKLKSWDECCKNSGRAKRQASSAAEESEYFAPEGRMHEGGREEERALS